MKKVIKGKVYDSSTAKKVAIRFTGMELDRTGWEELYQKKNGEFFILMHKYNDQSETITPVSYGGARQWAMDYLEAEEFDDIFGEIEEDDSTIRTTISTTAAEMEIIKRNAAQAGMTVSAYIVHRCAE